MTDAPVLHLVGTIVADDEREYGEAWVVGSQLCLTKPSFSGYAERVEGFVFPGLVDVHCHIGTDSGGAVTPDVARTQALADRNTGVLLVRDAGSSSDTSWVHDEPDLPRLIRAGRFIARPKRYLRHLAHEIDTVGELPAAVAEQAQRGDGWVKLVADWIDRDLPGGGDLAPLWTDEALAEAIAGAHALDARVTAHTFATEAVDGLLDAGIDCLEHGTGMTDAHIERAAREGIPVTPTLLQVERFEEIAAQGAERYPVYAQRMRAMHARRYEHVRNLHDAGVQLLVGTDAGGSITHGQIVHEAQEMVAAGVPAPDVVAALTWRTRAWLGAEGISEGASADVVVYASDPRKDIAVLHHPRAIVLRGNVVA